MPCLRHTPINLYLHHMRPGLILFLILMGGMPLCSQDHGQEDYSFVDVSNHLPNARVTGIAQDSRGFMWFSTHNGLYRYDGLQTRAFRSGPDADGVLGFNRIIETLPWTNNRLVLAGNKSVILFDMMTGTALYQSPDNWLVRDVLIQNQSCYFLFENQQRESIIVRINDEVKPEIYPLHAPPGFPYLKFAIDAKGQVYAFDSRGVLWHIDLNTDQHACIDSLLFHLSADEVIPELVIDNQDQLYVIENQLEGANNGYRYEPNRTFSPIPHIPPAWNITPGRQKGDYWTYDPSRKMLQKFSLSQPKLIDVLTLADSIGQISCVFEDRQGNLWIGSYDGAGNGLQLAHPHLEAFQKIAFTPGKESARGIACRPVTVFDGGKVWIGSTIGILQHDPALQPQDVFVNITSGYTQQAIGNIWSLQWDASSRILWFTMEYGGVWGYDISTGQLEHYMPEEPENHVFMGLCLDPKGWLWITSRTGILWFDTHTRTFKEPSGMTGPYDGVPSYNWVQTDPDAYWLCSSTGLFRFDSTRTMVKAYTLNSTPALRSSEVHDIIKEGDQYWIATDNGLHRLSGDSIQVYTMQDGLPHYSISGLALDHSGNMWISTYWGISKRDKVTGGFQNFYIEDGLPNNEFNRTGRYVSSDGRIYFSSQNGVLYFDPSEINAELPSCPLVLTDFVIFGEDGKLRRPYQQNIDLLKEVIIPAGNKYFELEFALLNYIHPEGNRYSYYLEGFDESWRPPVSLPMIQYNNLPPGQYTLHIRAQTPSGQWSANTIQLQVQILRHFYQTFWFNLIAGGLLLASAFWLLQLRNRRRLEIEQMRTRISSDLHDEVGGVLSGVAMQMDVLESRAPDHLKPFMQRVAHSSREAASKMRDVIWSIDSSKETFQDLLDRMKACTIEMLDPLEIQYRFDLSGIAAHQHLDMNFRQNVYLIYKEAISNILKHAGATQVLIRMQVDKNQFQLTISDNGTGLKSTTGKAGHGLISMERRAEKIKGVLSVSARDEGGTRVALRAPLE